MKTNLHSPRLRPWSWSYHRLYFHHRSRVSVLKSSSCSLGDWEFCFFRTFFSYFAAQNNFFRDGSASTQKSKKTARTVEWFPILIGWLRFLLCYWLRTVEWFPVLIGWLRFLLFLLAYFSPLNSPFYPAKCAAMPDEIIIIINLFILYIV